MWCGVVWCGVVWCGVVWCGVVWCGVVWCGVVWCGVVWCGVVWCGVVWCGVVWCGVVWCGVVWCGVVWCGVVWCGVVWCGVVWCGVVWCGVVWCGVVWCVGVVWCEYAHMHKHIHAKPVNTSVARTSHNHRYIRPLLCTSMRMKTYPYLATISVLLTNRQVTKQASLYVCHLQCHPCLPMIGGYAARLPSRNTINTSVLIYIVARHRYRLGCRRCLHSATLGPARFRSRSP